MNGGPAKTKIAILGGGVGALAAAFDLTENDPAGDLYDITVYQVGWRLGGKGAVGWTCPTYPTPGFNTEQVQLEHGLHVWGGFYDNAFDLVQRCYDALGDPAPYRNFLDAFTPVDRCWVMDHGTGRWRRWQLTAPPNRRTPGISRYPPTTNALWSRLLSFVTRASRDRRLTAHLDSAAAVVPFQYSDRSIEFARRAQSIASGAGRAQGVLPWQRMRLLGLVDFATQRLHETYFVPHPAVAGGVAYAPNEEFRRIAIMINIGVALLLGMLDAGVLYRGFDCLDDSEWSEWMSVYGAWDMSLKSGLVTGFYDYIFGYDPFGKRMVAAGTSTRAFLRLVFAYKGSLFYKLNVTMGEFLFAPVYQLLVNRGVKFQFFSRIDRLGLSADKKSIEEIHIGVQAYLMDRNTPYQPLIVTPDGMKSWPNRPDYGQLQNGDAIYQRLVSDGQDLESPWNAWGVVDTQTLSRTNGDFDKVILGISLGALGAICADLCNDSPHWGAMVGEVKTCPTLAAQLWLNKPASDYDWPYPDAIVTAFEQPLNTWGNNSQLIDQEAWPSAKPQQLAYFVGNLFPVDDMPRPNARDPFPVTELQGAVQSVAAWMRNDLPILWPGYNPADLALDPYVRVNVNPSDRYVQCVPGSLERRLAPHGSGYDNLFLAGDWVRIGLNAGCIEQAVLGGRAAARAITGVDMNGQYDGDRNSMDDGMVSPPLAALLANLPDVTRLALAGQGSIDARCIVLFVSIDDVIKKLLPPGLTFGPPQTSAAATRGRFPLPPFPPPLPFPIPIGIFPIVLLSSQQKNVRPGFMPFGGLNYLEFAIVLHNIYTNETNTDYNGPYLYMPRILLNSFPAMMIGTTAYGFRKRLARIHRVEDSFLLRNDEGEVSAQFASASLLGQLADFPALPFVQHILEHPTISETTTGEWKWSYLDYHLESASFQSLSGSIDISQGPIQASIMFSGIVGPGNTGPTTLAPLGFRMITDWDITLPAPAGEHDGVLAAPKRLHAAAITSRLMTRLRGRR
jgi:uncharacterized protein with NAD-binding domain and iron-sulfur cluster